METGIKFSEIAKHEFSFEKLDELWSKDYAEACATVMKDGKQHKPTEIEDYAVNQGKTKQWLSSAVFPSTKTGYFIIEKGSLVLKIKESWAKYEKKIRRKSKKLYEDSIEDCKCLYTAEVDNGEYAVHAKNKMVNLALPMNFHFDKTKLDRRNGKKIISAMKEILVSNDEPQWECIRYIFGCVTKRKASRIILFLHGLEGIGKSFIMWLWKLILGDSMAKTSEDVLSGETPFNSELIGASIAFLEETSGTSNYAKLMSQMKNLADAPELKGRYLYCEGMSLTNIINIIILSNHYRDVDNSCRKVFTPDTNNKYQHDTKFFADLEKSATEGALQYVFNYFYKVDVSKKLNPPDTQGKRDSKSSNMSNCLVYTIEEHLLKNPSEQMELKMSEAFNGYTSWCEAKQIKQIAKFDFFSQTIRNYLPYVEVDKQPKMKDKTHLYDFSEATLRNRFITRSKLLSEDQLHAMIVEYDAKNKKEKEKNKDTFFETDFVIMELEKENKTIKDENKSMKEELEKLRKLVEQYESEKKPETAEKKSETKKKFVKMGEMEKVLCHDTVT
jgi:hypothetical protein